MNPEVLAVLVRIGINKKVFKPSSDAIKTYYFTDSSNAVAIESPSPASGADCSSDPL